MIFLLSPAKSLDWSPPAAALPTTAPVLETDFGVLMRRSKRLSVAELQSLMSISDELAQLNHGRFQQMRAAPDPDADRPAALAFNGDVYRGLDARSLGPDDLAWAQDRVAILSGLYGVLRPLDLIQPYRLEMGTRLQTRRGESLYDFWGDKVSKVINQRLKAVGDEAPVVVDLASKEYGRVVKARALKAPVITPVFKEEMPDGKLRIISFYAKWARGAMVRWAIERRATDPAALQGFDTGGYRFRDELSTDKSWVFSRPKPTPAG